MADCFQRSTSSSTSFFLVYGVALLLFCTTWSAEAQNESTGEEASTRPPLTGIPQIDYIWDPNLPRELNGYNLSTYPFLRSVPEKIDFKCDGLHDGFYASIPHKCQVYHHCLFGTRYDFLCANFTAFDQKNFICHFASEVDCENSAKFYDRNEALYKAQSTTPAPAPAPSHEFERPARFRDNFPVRRRPGNKQGRRRRPVRPVFYDDYYDYDYEYDVAGGAEEDPQPVDDIPLEEDVPASNPSTAKPKKGNAKVSTIFDEPRAPPKIRPPVPNAGKKAAKPRTTTAAPDYEEPVDEFVDDNSNAESIVEEIEPEPTTKRPPPRKVPASPQRPKAPASTTTTTTTTAAPELEEQVPQKPSRRPNADLFNAGTRRPNVLVNKRLKTTTSTTAAPSEFLEEEEEPQVAPEEPSTAATRVPVLITRRPSKPATEDPAAPQEQRASSKRPGARRGPQAAPQPLEEKQGQPQQSVKRRPGSRPGPQTLALEPVEDAPVQAPVRRRPGARQGPQAAAPVAAEPADVAVNAEDEPVEQRPAKRGPGFRRGPQGESTRQQRQDPAPVALEETFEESQLDLSILNLFSNARPRAS